MSSVSLIKMQFCWYFIGICNNDPIFDPVNERNWSNTTGSSQENGVKTVVNNADSQLEDWNADRHNS